MYTTARADARARAHRLHRHRPEQLLGHIAPYGEIACSPTYSTALSLAFEVTGTTVPQRRLERSRDRMYTAVAEQLKSPPCLHWTAEPASAERHVDVRVHEHVDPRLWLATLSGLTLTLIPAVATADVTITADVVHGDPLLTTRTWRMHLNVWIELFLVFAMPVASPRRTDERGYRQLGREIVARVESTLIELPPALEQE